MVGNGKGKGMISAMAKVMLAIQSLINLDSLTSLHGLFCASLSMAHEPLPSQVPVAYADA